MWRRGERVARDWELMYTRGRFMLMCDKTNTILQSKIKNKTITTITTTTTKKKRMNFENLRNKNGARIT